RPPRQGGTCAPRPIAGAAEALNAVVLFEIDSPTRCRPTRRKRTKVQHEAETRETLDHHPLRAGDGRLLGHLVRVEPEHHGVSTGDLSRYRADCDSQSCGSDAHLDATVPWPRR